MVIQTRTTVIGFASGILMLTFGYFDVALLLLTIGVFLGCIEIGDK